jgi:hypothetical protein
MGEGKGMNVLLSKDLVLINFYLTPKKLHALSFCQIVQSRA